MKIIIDAPSTSIADAIKKELEKQLQEEAIKVSSLRTEIANEVNTEWTPINLKEDK